MQRMKLKFEMKLKKQIKKPLKHVTTSSENQKLTPNPIRLTDNGTLDTYLHRIRLEISKQKQQPNKERKTSIKGTNP